MFCPSCGLQEIHSNQFCRACGTDLRVVRSTLEKPDIITASATSAREEIGRAFAARINNVRSAEEMQVVAEDVLPEIEKFLESPEEKKMRRFRSGSIVLFVGLGVMVGFTLAGLFADNDLFFFAALGMVTFFVGLGLIVNGQHFTVTKKTLEEKTPAADSQRELDNLNTSELLPPPNARHEFTSVTENTTRHLKDKQPVSKD